MAPLRLMPAPLHRALLRLAHRIRVGWWQVVKPQIEGCRVIAVDGRGRVLLVRHAYGSPLWMPPGGGVKRGEDPALAGAREFEEEVGCRLEQPREIATIIDSFHGAKNRVHIIHGSTSGTPRPDGREISAAAFFALDALPADLARGLAEKLPHWARGEAEPASPWPWLLP